MTTTRFISPSLPRRVLSRLSYLPYTKGFPRIFLSPIFSPGYHLCSGIIFTYICLYLFFFFLSCTVRRFLLSNSTYQFIYLFIFLSFFISFFFLLRIWCEFHSNLFDLNFGSEIVDRGFEHRFDIFSYYVFILCCFLFFLSFFLQRNSILDP